LLLDVTLQPHASIVVDGKGRRERCLPLWKVIAAALRAWLAVRGIRLTPEVFVNARGHVMTRSGFEYILEKHVKTTMKTCLSLLTSSFLLRELVLRTTMIRFGAMMSVLESLLLTPANMGLLYPTRQGAGHEAPPSAAPRPISMSK
jgi:site-specific recombinase XerD